MSEMQPEAAPEATPETPEEPWAPSQEEFSQMQEALQALAPLGQMYEQYVQEQEYPQFGQQQVAPPPDAFSENWGPQLDQYIDQRIQQATSQYSDLFGQFQYEQLEEQARDILHDYKSANDIEFRGEGADDWVLAQ